MIIIASLLSEAYATLCLEKKYVISNIRQLKTFYTIRTSMKENLSEEFKAPKPLYRRLEDRVENTQITNSFLNGSKHREAIPFNKVLSQRSNQGANQVGSVNKKRRMLLIPVGKQWNISCCECCDKRCHKVCEQNKCYCRCPTDGRLHQRFTAPSKCSSRKRRICRKLCYRSYCRIVCRKILSTTCRNIVG